jgi:rhamnulose-1-phosphate aldolase/alcohol dehydrogenase
VQSRWREAEARAFALRYADAGEALALRVYSSRLIGSEPELVLHGGGNTSLKSHARNRFGEEVAVLHVKGSGWDLGSIEPAGLPAVALGPLLRLRSLERLDDETMVAELRRGLLDPGAPNPSVETLLHAFLPHACVDHSHANAILVLCDQPDGEARIRELYGARVGFLPYVMPGFALAKRAAECFEKAPEIEGLVLDKHGLFTFGTTARESYERHVELVDRAERAAEAGLAAARARRRGAAARAPVRARDPVALAPLLRGALAEPADDPDRPWRRWILEHRASSEIEELAASEACRRLAATPPITPDHVIRTKGAWLVAEPSGEDDATLRASLAAQVESYRAEYRDYFARNVRAKGVSRTPLDPTPRVVLVPGAGLFAVGESAKAARIAADLAEANVRVKLRAETLGRYEPIAEGDLFDMEYWSLEQAKLGSRERPVLGGEVALVTGGAGAIGEGVAASLLDAGAHVVLADRDGERLEAVAARLASPALSGVVCDVADERSVERAFDEATRRFGGVDLLVLGAGIARAGRLDALSLDEFRSAVDVNLVGTFLTLRAGLRRLARQGTGGNVVLISTKNVFAPGAEFGAYSASKAGAHQLARIAALEGAAHGVRVNLINADAVFGDTANPSGLWREVGPARAAARGLPAERLPDFYRERNLLRIRVTPRHVGQAVVFFASQKTPTTGAVLPIDGGLPEAFPR